MNERGAEMTTTFPTITDYVEAVQDPMETFRERKLQRAEFVLDPRWQVPRPASGNAAVVFRATVAGRDQALRFFIQEDVSEKRRYTALDRHFYTNGLADCVARTTWVDEAIRIDDRWWPMVQMEWVDGETLDAHVRALAGRRDAAALDRLALTWRRQVQRLQAAEFAHGDLQHGNILVGPAGELRLVDFDGSWIAAFEDLHLNPPRETGHPNYQHVGRTWGRWMDTFPALVIYTGLLALARRPDAWRNNEGILFTRDDLMRPGDTPIWRLLTEIPDPGVQLAAGRLYSSCDTGWTARGDLEGILTPERITTSPPPVPTQRSRPIFQLSDNPPDDWYLKGRVEGAGGTAELPREQTFTGVHDSGAGSRPSTPHPQPTRLPMPAPTPHPQPTRLPRPAPTPTDTTVPVAAVIALVLAIVIGSVVGASDGPGGVVGVLTAVVAFAIALPVLRSRR
jgi:hypothetical protein